MKKYIQYNQPYCRDTQSDSRSSRPLPQDTSVPRNRIGALDLSGKQRTSTPGHTPKQQWTNDQETALDLSGYGKPEVIIKSENAINFQLNCSGVVDFKCYVIIS